jgi:hypothetical protein
MGMKKQIAIISLGLMTALGCAKGESKTAAQRHPQIERGVCAVVLMPGQNVPMGEPGAQPGCGGGFSSIGGGGVQMEAENESRREAKFPLGAVLAGPAAVVGGGIAKAGEMLGDDPTQSNQSQSGQGQSSQSQSGQSQAGQGQSGQSQSSQSGPVAQSAPPAPRDPQLAQEEARLAALERELARRSAPAPPAGESSASDFPIPIPVPIPPAFLPNARPSGRSLSIADELASLQASTRPEAKAPPPDLVVPGSVRAESGGVADRVADRDGDGRPDHWIYRQDERPVRELFDENGDGNPDRTVLFDPESGQERRVEEDRNLDGRLDSWVDYREGTISRHRRDTDYDGSPDSWSFYLAGELARQEEDLNGDGFRNRIAFFESGRLVREREDRDGDGRIDRVTLYDGTERVAQRDEDRDGDGLIDTRSYYEAGRLVRRELVSEESVSPDIDEEELTDPAWSNVEDPG